jgi:hypothetical protein
MILELLTILLVIDCLFILIGIFIKRKSRKISTTLTVISTIFLFISLIIFYLAMSEVTNVGVGSFSGEGNLVVSVPGLSENNNLYCTWGSGNGFYLCILSLVSIFILSFIKIYKIFGNKIKIKI